MSHKGLKIAFGTSAFRGTEATQEALDAIASAGVKEIDTAHIYGGGKNEEDLGNAGVGDGRFIVSTKNAGGWATGVALLPENLSKAAYDGMRKLKMKKVDIYYIHAPDRTLKPEQWVGEIDKLYKEGLFKRFGVSNFTPEEVREVYDYAKANGFVLPTVYQGNYSAIARQPEGTLFPVLRELGIAFYAYSTLAGGFLTKTREQVTEGTGRGRWAKEGGMPMYKAMYMKPSYLDALGRWHELAEEEGTSQALLAYRWVSYHSALSQERGDTIVLGASSTSQIHGSVEGLAKGPLKQSTVQAIEEIWKSVEKDAPINNFETATASTKS